jgi:predicted enzyme related to lactoylglutathione lyase
MGNSILGLRTTAYKVGDIEKAKVWYTLAFETEPYFDKPFYVGFNIGGYELGLQPEDTPASVKGENVVTYWGVTDIIETFNRFIALQAEPHEEPQNVGGEIMVASVKDPWGNIIGIIFNPDFKIEG